LANPDRFKELQRQCRDDWDKLGNAQCNAVTEAERKRFMGKGTPYTPYPIKSFSIPSPAPKTEAR